MSTPAAKIAAGLFLGLGAFGYHEMQVSHEQRVCVERHIDGGPALRACMAEAEDVLPVPGQPWSEPARKVVEWTGLGAILIGVAGGIRSTLTRSPEQ